MPVVADGTSSVFYPGKLVFFCRFLSYPARYGIYLAIHIPIAAAGRFGLPGRFGPTALPGADRIWVPSIYAGLLVVLIGMVGMRLRGRRRKQVWLTRVLSFFAIASFGWDGAVWLFNEIALTAFVALYFQAISNVKTLR